MCVETTCQILGPLCPFFHLHDRQEGLTLPLDHAELCAQTIRENAGGNSAYQVLPGMIWDSACPLSCRAPHEGGWAKNPNCLALRPSSQSKAGTSSRRAADVTK